MDKWELMGSVLGLIAFLAWVPSMRSWIRRGVSIPRHIHLVAVVLTSISIGCLVGMLLGGLVTLKLALAFILIPPAGTYLGWFWMFGPDLCESKSS